jgi:hypothetical protein
VASVVGLGGNVDTEVEKENLNNSATGTTGSSPARAWLHSRIVAVLALSFLLAACNTVRFGYEQLPRLVQWQADRFLSLDSQQEALVNGHAKALQRWHRQSLLPVYAEFLQRVEGEMRSPVTVEHVAGWRQAAVDGWQPIAEKLAPAVAEVALTLRPEQIDYLKTAIEKANRKTAGEYLQADPVKRQAARYERLVERAESFMGKVSEPQKQQIRASAAAMASGDDAWWESRLARQKAIVDLLAGIVREKPPLEEATRRTRGVLSGLFDHHRAASPSDSDADKLTVRLLALATPEQRQAVVKRLDGYRQDFDLLAAR